MNICVHQYGRPEWYRRDQDQNDESALKVGPSRQCLQPHVQQLLFQSPQLAVKRLSERNGQPRWSKQMKKKSSAGNLASQNVQLDAEPHPIC